MLRRLHEFPNDDSQDQKIADDTDDEYDPVEGRLDVVEYGRRVWPGHSRPG